MKDLIGAIFAVVGLFIAMLMVLSVPLAFAFLIIKIALSI